MPQPFEPTPEAVKALLPARIQGRPFSETTIPSRAEVLALISEVAEDILDRFEVEVVPADLLDRAERATRYEVASRLELQFWPEQSGRRGDISSSISTAWHERAERVIDRLQEILQGYDPDEPVHGLPKGNFPAAISIPTERYEPLGQKGF